MEIKFFTYLGYTILCYLITYLAGSLLYSFFGNGEKTFYNEFKKNVLGIWTIIVGYSLFQTKFVTLSLGMVLIAILWWAYNRPRVQFRFHFYGIGFLISTAVLIFFYCLLYLDIYDPVYKHLYYYFMDLPVYASIVERINATGVESTIADLVFKEPLRNLYHYGDIWFPAFFVRILGLNAMQSVYFIYTAIAATTIFCGALAILQEITGDKKIKPYQIFMALAFITLSGLSWYVPRIEYFNARWGDQFNLLGVFKAYLLCHALIWAVLLVMRKDYKNMVFALLMGLALNLSSGTGLLLALGCFLLLLFITREISFKQTAWYSLPVICFVTFIIIYGILIVRINAQHGYSAPPVIGSTDSVNWQDFLFYKRILSVMLDTGIRVTIAMLPFFILIFIFRKTIFSERSFLLTLVFVFIGLYSVVGAYGFFNQHPDGFQFWTVPNACLSALFVFLVFARLQEVRWTRLLFVILVIVCIYQNRIAYTDPDFTYKRYPYDHAFTGKVLKIIQEEPNAGFAFLNASPKNIDVIWGFSPNLYFPNNYLKFFVNNYNPYCLSVYDVEYSHQPKIRALQLSSLLDAPFSRYIEKQKAKNEFVSIQKSQVQFIKRANIKYVFIQTGAVVHDELKPLIKETYTDPESNYSFCVLAR